MAAPDDRYNKVSLLLHCEGADTSTTITDNAPTVKTVVCGGNAQISTARSKWGSSSVLFDGAGDYLTATDHADFAFGTGDFTIEFWMYLTGGGDYLYDSRPNGTNSGAYPTIYVNNGPLKLAFMNTATERITGTTTLTTSVWHHVAVSRTGTSTRMFLNGVQEGATYTDSTNYINGTARPIIFGNGFNTTSSMPGNIDDVRVTKGFCRYTATFTPPVTTFADFLTPSDAMKLLQSTRKVQTSNLPFHFIGL